MHTREEAACMTVVHDARLTALISEEDREVCDVRRVGRIGIDGPFRVAHSSPVAVVPPLLRARDEGLRTRSGTNSATPTGRQCANAVRIAACSSASLV